LKATTGCVIAVIIGVVVPQSALAQWSVDWLDYHVVGTAQWRLEGPTAPPERSVWLDPLSPPHATFGVQWASSLHNARPHIGYFIREASSERCSEVTVRMDVYYEAYQDGVAEGQACDSRYKLMAGTVFRQISTCLPGNSNFYASAWWDKDYVNPLTISLADVFDPFFPTTAGWKGIYVVVTVADDWGSYSKSGCYRFWSLIR